MIPRALLLVLAAAFVALGAAPAHASPLGAPVRISGLPGGSSLPSISSVGLAPDGTTAIAGTVSAAGGRRVVAGVGSAQVFPRGVPGDVLSQPMVAVRGGGDGAVVWAIGRRVLLSLCDEGRCATPVEVGRSQLNPQAQVAIDPASGRVTVLWRGSASGHNRLQWRITTGGRLGPVHTLGELGSTPRIGTDASGKSVAVWLGEGGVRASARRKGEFLRPTTIATGAAQGLRLDVASSGQTIAAWRVPAPGGADVQSPRGTPVSTSRTRDTGFGPVAPVNGVADAGTLDVAIADDGRAVLAFDRQADDVTATVSAAYRAGAGLPFGPAVALSTPQFVSEAWGSSAAIDGQGVATVTWGGASTVSAARSDATSAFGPAQAIAPLGGQQSTPVLAAAAGPSTLAVWADASGGWMSTGS
jgi:hypothetical protein